MSIFVVRIFGLGGIALGIMGLLVGFDMYTQIYPFDSVRALLLGAITTFVASCMILIGLCMFFDPEERALKKIMSSK